MKAARLIAQRLFDARVRFKSEHDNGALLLMPASMQRYAVTTWHAALHYDIEVSVSAQQVRALGPEQAWFDAAFEDMQSSEFAAEIDQALWEIQKQYIADCLMENRSALLKEQAA